MTVERLARIDRAESALRVLGVTGNLRVRDHGALARIEVDPALIENACSEPLAGAIARAIRDAGFARVAMDLAGFKSGSLNVLEGIVAP